MSDPAVNIKIIDNTIKIGYSGKRLGNTSLNHGPQGLKNYQQFTTQFPGLTVYDMDAVGKDKIINIDDLSVEEAEKTSNDGMMTTKSNALLTLRAADCIPLVLYVPSEQVLMLAHVGTNGAALHLPAKTVKAMGYPPDKIYVYNGPYISQKAYVFPDKDLSGKKLEPEWDPYISDEPDGLHINLLGFVVDELKKSGIKPENIKISEVDTGSNHDYFSHRRHKLTGEVNGRNCFGVCLI